MSASWKQYGGAKSLETNRKITTNTVVTDEIILKNSYIGGFTINGVLDVTGKAIFQGSLDVSGLITTSNIQSELITINNNSYLNGSVYIGIDLNTTRNIITGNSITVGKNIQVLNYAEINKHVYFDTSHSLFLYGSRKGIGVNTEYATSTFEISSNLINSLNVYTSQSVNRNIIAQNNSKRGIIVTADVSFSHIDFFTDNKTTDSTNYDGTIICKSGGIFQIDVSKNTQIMSALSVTNRNNPSHLLNETVVIYDISSRIYNPDIYNNSNSYTGNALTLISNDNKSNTSMNIVTPEKSGISIIGGAYAYDISRSMAAFGVIDSCSNYIQNQIIVSGTDPVKYKTTTGINTYIPRTEQYILDINGPIHIGNGDIIIVKITDFQINKMNISPSGKLLIASGYPANIIDTSYGSSRLVVSNDYGATWNETPFIQYDNTPLFSGKNSSGLSTTYSINDIYVYDNSYTFAVCSDNTSITPYLIWTNNSGKYWYNATIVYETNGFSNGIPYNFIKILIKDGPNNIDYVNLVISTTDNNVYTVKLIISGSNLNKYSQVNRFIFTGGNINSFTYYQNNILYFATSIGIYNINITNNFSLITGSSYNFSEIKCLNNSIISIGNGIITKSTDGTNFINSLFPNINFTSLFLYNNFGFTIGNKNTVWFSIDYGNNWNPLWSINSYENISQSGKQFVLTNPSNIFSNIFISDQNSLILSRTDISYSLTNPSQSSVINCFLPNLLNHTNNNVLDICGNMLIMGDIHIDNDGKIISNNSDFSLINENVNKVYFAGNANTIVIGNTTIGNTIIRNNLNVNLNTVLTGNVSIYGQETIFNITDSSSISTGALIINGGVGISKTVNIGGNLFVNRNSLFTGSVGVLSDTSLNGNLYVNSTVPSTNSTTGAVIISGGVGIGGNINIAKNTTILGNIFMPTLSTTAYLNTVNITGNNYNALYVIGSSILNGNISIYGQEIIYNITDSSSISTGALIVNGGVGISKTVNIGGNLFVNQNSLFTGSVGVLSDTSLNGNLYVNSSTQSNNTTTGAVIISGGVGIGGNINIAKNTTVLGNIFMPILTTTAYLNTVNITGNNYNALYVIGSSILNGNISLYGQETIYNTTDSYSISTGALIINGGVGISKTVNIGGNLFVNKNSLFTGSVGVLSDTSLNGNLYVNSSTQSNNTTTGAVIISGGVGVSKTVNIGGDLSVKQNSLFTGSVSVLSDTSLNGNLFINSSTPSTNSTTGAVIISGGVGINGTVNIAQNMNITGSINMIGSSSIANLNNIIVTSTIDSTTYTNGALFVNGGVGINKSINIGGSLIVYQDSVIYGSLNIYNDILTQGIATFNKDITSKKNINSFGNIFITNYTPSTSYTSGALIIGGGVGIGGNINIGGNTNIQNNLAIYGNIYGNTIITRNIFSNNTLLSVFSDLSVTGAINNTNNITTTGILRVNNNTPSLGINSGALIVNGGVSIGGDIYVGGNTTIQNSLSVSSTVTSAILTTNSIRTNNFGSKLLLIGDSDDQNTSQINIGSGKLLNIGELSTGINIGQFATKLNIGSLTGGTNTTQINIGGTNDRTIFNGTVTFPAGTSSYTTVIQNSNYVILNTDQSGAQVITVNQNYGGTSSTLGAGGLWFNDFSNQTMGQLVVTSDLKAFKLKAPFYTNYNTYLSDVCNNLVNVNQNAVRLDIAKLITSINTNGLVIISPLSGDPDNCKYTITGTSLDISNILTKNKDTIPNMQVIPTNITINNSLSVTNNATVNGNVNIYGNLNSISNAIFNNININTQRAVTNSSLTIVGNAIISKLGIGTSSVNTNANSLEVQGNFYHGGFIYQF